MYYYGLRTFKELFGLKQFVSLSNHKEIKAIKGFFETKIEFRNVQMMFCSLMIKDFSQLTQSLAFDIWALFPK